MPQQEENRITGSDDVCHNKVVATDKRVRHQTQPRDITPRSLPAPISGSSSNGFYVGTVRDPRRYSLGAMIRANEKKCFSTRPRRRVVSSSTSSSSDKGFREDCDELEKENCCDREFTTFFFDEEMHLLANEIAKSDRRYSLMSYEKLDSPMMEDQPIRNYEDLVPGRHRRSGNERVHPNNLYTAFSRSKRRLERDLPSWIDAESLGKNDERSYWQDRINNYQNVSKPFSNRDRAFCGRTAVAEGVHSEPELDSCESAPSQQLCDISTEIFGFSEAESDVD
ncbi:unnamed protein product [Cylicocyclus nassatus]|uniref:Uncharacterized protein n=1 Tax=Cylicocyclus nassatus TaxID=53992 RepID=A0AA36MHL3_CYLNA|nr:unnamed protein product [Cylicocyclus nassatus]